MIDDITPWKIFFLFLVGGFTGFVDSIAGGGGLVSLPILISMGLPPHIALGTNKFQGTFGTGIAMIHYRRAKLMRLRDLIPGIFFTIVGSVLGTVCVQKINSEVLSHIIPWLLLTLFFFTLFSPKLGEYDKHHRLKPFFFYLICGLIIGFYDGFFGPGAGSFWPIAFVILLGFNLKKATAHAKVMNFSSNVVSFITFLYAGFVILPIGLAMALGQFAGSTLGSRMVIRKGTQFVRIFFLIVVGCTLLKVFWQAYF